MDKYIVAMISRSDKSKCYFQEYGEARAAIFVDDPLKAAIFDKFIASNLVLKLTNKPNSDSNGEWSPLCRYEAVLIPGSNSDPIAD